jgi:hypothetical protein
MKATVRLPQVPANSPVSQKSYVAPAPAPAAIKPVPVPVVHKVRVRPENWDTIHFHQFLEQRANMPFKWGSNDCALFAADGIQAITGIDIASAFRDKYTTQAGAMAAIKEITGGTTVADAAAFCAASSEYFEELTHPLMAKRGDLVIVDNDGQSIAGLVHLTGRHVVTVTESGLARLPITAILRAWHFD